MKSLALICLEFCKSTTQARETFSLHVQKSIISLTSARFDVHLTLLWHSGEISASSTQLSGACSTALSNSLSLCGTLSLFLSPFPFPLSLRFLAFCVTCNLFLFTTRAAAALPLGVDRVEQAQACALPFHTRGWFALQDCCCCCYCCWLQQQRNFLRAKFCIDLNIWRLVKEFENLRILTK